MNRDAPDVDGGILQGREQGLHAQVITGYAQQVSGVAADVGVRIAQGRDSGHRHDPIKQGGCILHAQREHRRGQRRGLEVLIG